jgi:hypothetical protein
MKVLILMTLAAALAIGEIKVPAGAEKIDAYTHRHKDAQGKVWIYRQTPFGVVKYEEKSLPEVKEDGKKPTPWGAVEMKPEPVDPARAKAEQRQIEMVKMTEDGDSLKFEKPSPWGVVRWTKKKTDLNEDEKKIWELKKGQEKK